MKTSANLVAAAALAGCLSCARQPEGVLADGDPVPDIQGLAVQAGNRAPFDLGEERGRMVMLAFGYTSCVSVCPLTLDTMSSIYRRLGPDGGALDALFISIDPRRDTPESMRTFLEKQDSRIRGVLLPEQNVSPLLQHFGISAARLPPEIRRYVGRIIDPERDYALEHSPTLWVMDGSGRLRGRYDRAQVEDVANGIRRLIRSQAALRPRPGGQPGGA